MPEHKSNFSALSELLKIIKAISFKAISFKAMSFKAISFKAMSFKSMSFKAISFKAINFKSCCWVHPPPRLCDTHFLL